MFGVTVNIGLVLVSYLLGSFPTGYLAARILKGIDIREQGSGSIGATNVLRTLGKGPAIVVLLVDAAKGALAIALAHLAYSFSSTVGLSLATLVTLAGLAAIIGHSWPIWLNFKGGKSVATSLGILLAMSWQVGLATFGVFAVMLAITRIVSFSSIVGAIAVSALMFGFGQPLPYQIFAIAAGIYVIWRHRSNIQRLLAGTEPKIGQKLQTETEQTT
ncbi:glycerol-3-phosphate 1-O-acyltransferase PlsY [Planktothrix sp. FACHB-1355]|uniref:Glycerol-3-phosphate acyltransferase n=1 Tax=Aerosakkonema funiforme FACHB-1375 TaxID=2949571 RepID=A0A926VJM2_9CYAN|nr:MULTISPECIES: glycerol-3-phosphate 1-O-acyltransferase PlsY [Oscillatoriales]MBD2183719.1 glycerol-3-phosphate 1-O-acyltransferase PlsY [Aerosakkonema funiforme FACHB-1375]MBD3558791.1 glycerol-3-phosphate 1-O-acyltransferase PlsY [Planktothrix sp. FACHB-1355]